MKRSFLLSAFFLILFGINSHLKSQPTYTWGKQFGGTGGDFGRHLVGDKDGGVIMAGVITGDVFGNFLGMKDAFIVKYNADGEIVWQDQFGSELNDHVMGLVADTEDNYWVLVHRKSGPVYNDPNVDLMIYKYNSSGSQISQILLTSVAKEISSRIYVDKSQNIYLYGSTTADLNGMNAGEEDCFVTKLDSSLNEQFTIQFGSSAIDKCIGLSVDDSSNIYLCGLTFGDFEQTNLGKCDAFIAKYTKDGEQMWLKQFGTDAWDQAKRTIIDKKQNVYVAGSSLGDFANNLRGSSDIIIMKLDKDGELIWKKQDGGTSYDEIWGMKFENSDRENILISGPMNTFNFLRAYFRMYDSDGNIVWNRYVALKNRGQLTDNRDLYMSPDMDIYLTGFTQGNLFSTSSGNGDAYITKFRSGTAVVNPLSINIPLNDIELQADSIFHYTIPLGHIQSDLEGDAFYYEVKLKGETKEDYWTNPNSLTYIFDGSPKIDAIYDDTTYHKIFNSNNSDLPSWISFNPTTLEFTGVPEGNEEFEIVLIIKNSTKHVITDEFKITVTAASGIH